MKYSVTSVAPKKAFDFAAATEAISETYIRMGDAYEQIVATEGKIAELETAMDNCRCAVQAIEKFGVTATTMAVFNGSNELDAALALEALDLSTVESLGQSVKKVRKENYISGLESKVGEYWAKFVAWLKELWAKIKRWFKELFDRNAKYARICNEAVTSGVFGKIKWADKEKKLNLITFDAFSKALAAAKALLASCAVGLDGKLTVPSAQVLESVGYKLDGDKAVRGEKFAEIFKKEEKSLADSSWEGGNVPGANKQFADLAIGNNVKDAAKNYDKLMSNLIKDAEAAKDDADKQAKVKERKENLPKLQSYLAAYNTLIGICGNALVTIINRAPKSAN